MNTANNRFHSLLKPALCVLIPVMFQSNALAQTAAAVEQAPQSTSVRPVSDELTTEDFIPAKRSVPAVEGESSTDATSGVLNKKVRFAKRLKVDLDYGTLADELIVNNRYSLLRLSYYINEDYSFGAGFRLRYGGQTSYSKQLAGTASQIDFSRAPTPEKAGFVSFGYNLLYGKMSLLKNISMPTLTKLNTDFGSQAFGQENRPFIQSSLEQSFFIGSHLSFGFNVGFGFAEVTDATSYNVNSSQPLPNESNFTTKMQFNRFFGAHLNILL